MKNTDKRARIEKVIFTSITPMERYIDTHQRQVQAVAAATEVGKALVKTGNSLAVRTGKAVVVAMKMVNRGQAPKEIIWDCAVGVAYQITKAVASGRITDEVVTSVERFIALIERLAGHKIA